jgi:hypothetical protein
LNEPQIKSRKSKIEIETPMLGVQVREPEPTIGRGDQAGYLQPASRIEQKYPADSRQL